MKKIALAYASHDGHTKKIAERLQKIITQNDCLAELIHIGEFDAKEIPHYDFVVFGSPIRYGKHLPEMTDFLNKHKQLLNNQKSAFFSVNLTARKAHRNTPKTSNYVKKTLKKMQWKPAIVEVFAGKLNYPIYPFFDKHIIRFIMLITKGPTDTSNVIDFTNWKKVDAFATHIVNQVKQL